MSEQNLYFNILTFDFPSEKQVFYFSKEDIAKSHKIHKSIFPRNRFIISGDKQQLHRFYLHHFFGRTGRVYATNHRL